MTDFSVFGDREKAGWSNEAVIDGYVAGFGPVTDRIARVLCDKVAAPGRDVLDLCCGQGRLTAMLGEAGANVTGLDFSPGMLKRAAKAAPGATLVEGDAMAQPFDDASFDAVVCNFGIMHIPDQPKALGEVRRVLRPGGSFVMSNWVGPAQSPAFGMVFGAIKAFADLSGAPAQPDLFAYADPATAEEKMAAAGMKMTAHDVVTPSWEMPGPDGLFEIFSSGTVAAKMLLSAQSPDVVEKIRARITGSVADAFQEGGGYRVPVPVAVVTAVPA